MNANPGQLTHLRITILCELDDEGRELIRHLQRTRAIVRHLWPAPERFGDDTDLLLCEYGPGLGQRLTWMPGEPKAALIVLLPQVGHVDAKELKAACPEAVLHRPYTTQAIDVAVMLAMDQFGFARRQRLRVQRLEENIHALRDIERAKQMIMARNHVGEADAFRTLRDMAMQRRITLAALASKLVDSVDIPT